MTAESGDQNRVRLLVTNPLQQEVSFVLEPWGEVYAMPPGATFEVVAEGPAGATLEVQMGDEQITVYGWAGSVVSLYHSGLELGSALDSRRTPAPSLPS